VRGKQLSLWIASLALLPLPAYATDGVREINQTCATTTGCFAGDTGGFPVTIADPGSYRLTGNLLRPNANTHGVTISVSDVTLDLNGFQISGGTNCSGVPVTCAAPGTGRGVTVDSEIPRGVLVRNGSVRGSGAAGVYVAGASRVEDVRVASSGADGIRIGDGSRVRNCEVYDSAGRGVGALGRTVVEGSIVSGTGSAIPGIEVSGDSPVIRGNEVRNAHGDGIRATGFAFISGNHVTGSGGDGVEVSGGARIAGNLIALNVGFGIRFGFNGSLYTGNTLVLNSAGSIVGPANVSPGDNSCESAAC
jgi:hypothetical protein